MKNKAVRITLDVVTSFVVFIAVVLVVIEVAGKILGTTKGADGTEKLNGGSATSITLLGIAFVVTILFALWFYQFLSNHKISRTEE